MADLGALLQPTPMPKGPAPDLSQLFEMLLLERSRMPEVRAQLESQGRVTPTVRGSVAGPLLGGQGFVEGSYEPRGPMSGMGGVRWGF